MTTKELKDKLSKWNDLDLNLDRDKLIVSYGNAEFEIIVEDDKYHVKDVWRNMNGLFDNFDEVLNAIGLSKDDWDYESVDEELIECIVKEDLNDKGYNVENHPTYGKLYSFNSQQGLLNYLEDFENGKID